MKIKAFGAALAVILASSIASAQSTPVTTLTILGTTGGNPAALAVGEDVTIQVTLTNPTADDVFGLGLSVHDYSEAVVSFQSGMAVASYLNAICTGPGSCFGGLANLAAGSLVESSIGANGNRVQLALSAGLVAVPNTGSLDQGLDNVQGSSQFDITFRGVAEGSTTLIVGTGYQGDQVILAGGANTTATNDTITITVPEPGAIAAGTVALGSVLALAGIRRRI